MKQFIPNEPLVLGIDLGTSGARIAVINKEKSLKYFASTQYESGLDNCYDWQASCKHLISKIPLEIKNQIIACSVDGTSGTLMGCNEQGTPLSKALPYFHECMKKLDSLQEFEKVEKGFTKKNGSLARAFKLITLHGHQILLRHQADWISGWLLNDWSMGEEGNNLKLGWDYLKQSWPIEVEDFLGKKTLPTIVPSGSSMGTISPIVAKELNLPNTLEIIAGTTDSNAAVLATDASPSEGITILGSTIVIKRFTKTPIKDLGITNHKVCDQWLIGGASNAGCLVLNQFFSTENVIELSKQINTEYGSGLFYRPLPSRGERFPKYDPDLEPILKPRPVSDSLFLHGLLEGLSRIEAQGWEKFRNLGLGIPSKIITLGGGSRNPQWRKIREKLIGIPIRTCVKQPAEGVARIALKAIKK